MPLQAIPFDLLLISHATVPWLVLSRRLRKGRLLPAPPGETGRSRTPGVLTTLLGIRTHRPRGTARRSPDAGEQGAATGTDTKPGPSSHQALRCGTCGAPLPLADEERPCPHCGANVVPPVEIVAAYRHLEWARAALARAELAWKRAAFWNAPAWIIAFGLLDAAWSFALMYFLVARSGTSDFAAIHWLASVVTYMAMPSATCGWWIGVGLAQNAFKWPRVFPGISRRALRSLPAENVPCSNCGAEACFDEGRLATHCAYCGSEEVRPSLARGATAEARAVEGEARGSIVEAYRRMVERREGLLFYIDGMAGLQVVIGLVMLLDAIPYVGSFLDMFS